MRAVLRVDDVGQAVDQSQPDRGLACFLRWWEAGGWAGLPVCLGVVPAVLDEEAWRGLGRLARVSGVELALHGWDHAPGPLTPEHVRRGARSFAENGLTVPRAIVPPYNACDLMTLAATRVLADRTVLLGGFDGEHHHHGEAPVVVDGVLHLSACRDLYAHSYRVAERLEIGWEPPGDWPVVITLHHRWDAEFLPGVRRLRDLVADKLVSLDEVLREYAG